MGRRRHTTNIPGIRYRLLNEERPDGPRRYVIGYTDANGRYHTETLPVGMTLADAKARKAALEGKSATYVPVKKTVGELLDEYLASRKDLKAKTYEDYAWGVEVIKDEMGNRDLKALSPNDVASLTATLQDRGLKGASIRKILTPLVGALRVAVREGWIVANPMDRLLPHERPRSDTKKMRVLTMDEIQRLVAEASSDRWALLFQTLAFTGLRISEALALTWDDISEDEVTVYGTKTQAAERTVMLIPTLRHAFVRYWLQTGRKQGYVFANAKGTPVSRREALRALRAAEKRAGLPNYTLHELRHTFASMLIAQGENVTLVADQMGHANPAVTLTTYAKLFDAQKNVETARSRLESAVIGQ